MQDFTHALRLDPGNAELTKLLNTAREKYLEVEGVSAAVEEVGEGDDEVEVIEVPGPVAAAEGVEVQVQQVTEAASLVLPPSSAIAVKDGSLARATGPVSTFVRINVVSDDESDEEEDGGQDEAAGAPPSAFNRIAITEEDDSSEGESEGEGALRSAEQREQRAAELKEVGNALLKSGDAAGAILRYSESLAALPTYLPSLNNRAQAHLTLKVRTFSVNLCN